MRDIPHEECTSKHAGVHSNTLVPGLVGTMLHKIDRLMMVSEQFNEQSTKTVVLIMLLLVPLVLLAEVRAGIEDDD